MVISEASASAALTVADIGDCLRLSDAAGWNQTEDDWAIFIQQGVAIGIRDADGTLIASAAALPFDGVFGFVSMVLVDAQWRRRGLASQLLDESVATLRQRGLIPVLDATPAGAAVYSQQGFQGLFELERWRIEQAPRLTQAFTIVRPARPEDASNIHQLDTVANGVGRAALLDDFLARPDSHAYVLNEGSGFLIARRGRRATQLGPLVAPSLSDAQALLAAAFAALRDAIILDVPATGSGIADWLARLGFVLQRQFTRMALADSVALARPHNLFAVAGPEFG